MKYKYLSLFHIGGLHVPKDKDIVTLVEYNPNDAHSNSQITLASNADFLVFLRDRGLAIWQVWANAMLGGVSMEPFPEKVREATAKIQEQREKEFGSGSFLVFEFTGESDYKLPERFESIDDYIFEFDEGNLFDKAQIRKTFIPSINKTLACLFLVSNADYEIKKISYGIHLVNEDGKTIYPIRSTFEINPTVSSTLNEDLKNKFTKYIITASNNSDYNKIYYLLTQAAEDKDNLRSFLFAWTAFEIFISTAFEEYKSEFSKLNKSSSKSGSSELAKKFYSVALLLSKEAETDCKDFKKIKNIRNKYFHGENIDKDALPALEMMKILKKYLTLHLDYLSANKTQQTT